MPNPHPVIPAGADQAHGCSVATTPDRKVVICFHDANGTIFAYAKLDEVAAQSILGTAQVKCMAASAGVEAHGQVGHG